RRFTETTFDTVRRLTKYNYAAHSRAAPARSNVRSTSQRSAFPKTHIGRGEINMAAEIKKEIQLEIAHVLFIDIVGYSKLSINNQHAVVDELTQIVRASEQLQRAEAAGRLLTLPTGDGNALVICTF